MAKERRDSKNRILGKGEYQKSDGRYMYRYTDSYGNAQFVYSWTLTKTDRPPKGKTSGPCLRDLERDILKAVGDTINMRAAANATLNHYFDKYIESKIGLKPKTRANYIYMYNYYVRNAIGKRKLAGISYSDVKRFYTDLISVYGKSVQVVATLDSVIKPTFTLAVRDNCIRNNPTIGLLTEIKKAFDYQPTKKFALTIEQQNNLMHYIRNSRFKRWLPIVSFMLGTGCRVGEACGITWDDCDFINDVIHINKSLDRGPDGLKRNSKITISTPKTAAGRREIPMLPDVKEILKNEKLRQMREGFCCDTIDGVSGFVFISNTGTVLCPTNIRYAVKNIVSGFNNHELSKAEAESRSPNLLPDISPHIFRHTFCTRLCESSVDVKVVQEIMGHSSIVMTMDVYNNVTVDHKKNEIEKVMELVSTG